MRGTTRCLGDLLVTCCFCLLSDEAAGSGAGLGGAETEGVTGSETAPFTVPEALFASASSDARFSRRLLRLSRLARWRD